MTKREKILVVFFLSLLVLGATIHLVRSGASWSKPAGTVAEK
jgi:hypothetical protein